MTRNNTDGNDRERTWSSAWCLLFGHNWVGHTVYKLKNDMGRALYGDLCETCGKFQPRADEKPRYTETDAERIHGEMGDHGDTRTMHPRLVCRSCDSFVYLTTRQPSESDLVGGECDCSFSDPTRGELPQAWVPIGQYVELE